MNEAEKCPCCDNPWSRATGDLFAKICAECKESDEEENKKEQPNNKQEQEDEKEVLEGSAINPAYLDASVKPYDNFFRYANGGWMDQNTIPAGYPNWNSFLHLHVTSQERLKNLLEELNSKDDISDLSEGEVKVTRFYKAAMDEENIEEAGINPLQPALDMIDDAALATGTPDIAVCLGKIQALFGLSPFFAIGASPDYKKSEWSICQFYQGGLGLPDRDYYFDEDKAEKRDAYKKHVRNMLQLLESSLSDDDATSAAEMVYELELKLAGAHMTKTECRDPNACYNLMSIGDLTKRCSDKFDFAAFLEAATGKTVEDVGDVNVRNTAALEQAADMISSVGAETLTFYLKWNTVHSYAKYLSKAFVDENFDFFQKTLAGVDENKPRWKRAMEMTESALGEALGTLYCERYFDENCKEKALSIVEKVRQALEDRLKEVDWMTSDETREQALKKMNRFNVKIGYPDKWIDYSSLVIDPEHDFVTMVIASRRFDHARDVAEMAAPTDKDKWFMTPQTVNAYYHPSLNEIVFPAAILQPPMFDPNADDAVNFGSMGCVVGHEMTHGFDDKGRKFNFEGNMVDWWTSSDGEEYERRVSVMVKQANEFDVFGQKVKGELTCGENIADLGGLRLALRALKAQESFNDPPIEGFTPLQRFFFAWAQCWRNLITKERALQLLTLDPHGPNEMRCNGPLSNMPEFHEAFDIPVGAPMYKPVGDRVDIW